MSSLWKTTKSYSKAAAELASAPVTFAGGLVGKAGTVTSVTTTTATTLNGATVTTTTVTTSAAGFATAAAGVAVAAAAGTAAGQLVNGALSFFWDPEPIDTESKKFEPVSDAEIEAYLDRVLREAAEGMPRTGCITISDVRAADATLPGLGTAAADYATAAARLLVHVLRGAALGTSGKSAGVKAAAEAIRCDLDSFIDSMRHFAKLAKKNDEFAAAMPTISLNEYLHFIEKHERQGEDALPSIERSLISELTGWSGVSFREDFGKRIARWVAEGPDESEVAAFENAPDATLSIPDLLLSSVIWCWTDFDLGESDYL